MAWFRAPGARRSTSSGLAIVNVLGTGVQLKGDGLDPAHGLVAVAAATHSQYNFKFQVQGGKFQLGRNFKLELMNRGPSLVHIQSCSPSWPLSSSSANQGTVISCYLYFAILLLLLLLFAL